MPFLLLVEEKLNHDKKDPDKAILRIITILVFICLAIGVIYLLCDKKPVPENKELSFTADGHSSLQMQIHDPDGNVCIIERGDDGKIILKGERTWAACFGDLVKSQVQDHDDTYYRAGGSCLSVSCWDGNFRYFHNQKHYHHIL
jgi:hypothetical protein